MENNTSSLNQNLLERTITVNVILKCPKLYSLGKVLIALITFTGVQLTPIGKLTGIQSDRFDWCLQKPGTFKSASICRRDC